MSRDSTNAEIKKMSATPPPPSGGEDTDLDEIDSLTGKEKFKALQKMLSSSGSMYSPSAVAASSTSESPPAPPPKRTRVDDEKIAAKKLTHATKDRPRRKVRLPSREKLRRDSVEQLDPPLRPPLPNNTAMEDEEGLPPLPPPPAAPKEPGTTPPFSGKPLQHSCLIVEWHAEILEDSSI